MVNTISSAAELKNVIQSDLIYFKIEYTAYKEKIKNMNHSILKYRGSKQVLSGNAFNREYCSVFASFAELKVMYSQKKHRTKSSNHGWKVYPKFNRKN